MNNLIKNGQRQTLLIANAIISISILNTYMYQWVLPEIDTKKLIQQSIRILLTVGLMVAVYKGKEWAKKVSLVLFSLAILGGIVGLIKIQSASIIHKVPLILMLFVYSLALYHFGFAKSFKAFAESQRS